MSWDTNLIEEQKLAASHFGAHARLLAGPGTGKTLVLTRRIMYLIQERQIDPSQILALTFTRAAAAELRQRVAKELGNEIIPKISTLHSFALRQLLRNSRKLSALPQPLRIADDWEERNIIMEDIKRIVPLDDIDQTKEKFSLLSADWESLIADKAYTPEPRFIGAWQEHRHIFGYTLRSELVYQLKRSLEKIEDFSIEYPIQHLLVDEYQDLNKCDLAVIRAIANRRIEVFVAGDDDQSIYYFRKAHPEGIRSFRTEYEDSVDLPLKICKRCDPAILQIAEFVAELDTKRIKKETRAENGKSQGDVKLLRFTDQNTEAISIAKLCKHFIEQKHVNPEQILVLLRNDRNGAYSKELQKAFDSINIPLSIDEKSKSVFDNKLGRQVLALFRLTKNIEDHLAWRTLLQLRRNDLGEKKLIELYDLAQRNGLSFHQLLKRTADGEFQFAYRKKVSNEYKQIKDLAESITNSTQNSANTIEEIIRKSMDIISVESSEKVKLTEKILEFARANNISSIDELTSTVEISDSEIENEIEKDKVNVLTMHKAKGLTADIVFVLGAEDEIIPGKQEGEPELGDERRLLFVSLTRAKHNLYITYCNQRTGQQKMSGRNPGNSRRTLTRFLGDSFLRPESGESFVTSVTAK